MISFVNSVSCSAIILLILQPSKELLSPQIKKCYHKGNNANLTTKQASMKLMWNASNRAWKCGEQQAMPQTSLCETRNLRGNSSTLGFNQHKIAVTICRNKEQRLEHVITTTTEQPAQHSPWNTVVWKLIGTLHKIQQICRKSNFYFCTLKTTFPMDLII